jgi:hypothetical protein
VSDQSRSRGIWSLCLGIAIVMLIGLAGLMEAIPLPAARVSGAIALILLVYGAVAIRRSR